MYNLLRQLFWDGVSMAEKLKTNLSFLTQISTVIMEISKINSVKEAYDVISIILKRSLEIEEEYFFELENESIIEIFGKPFKKDLEDIVMWAHNKSDVSIFPDDVGSYILIPIVSTNKINFIYVGYTEEENFSNQFMTTIKLVSFLLGNLFENLKLYEKIVAKNLIIEENKNFLNSVLNSTTESIVVYDKNKIIKFENNNFSKIKENSALMDKIEEYTELAFNNKLNNNFEFDIKNNFYSIDIINIEIKENSYVLIVVRDVSGTKELEKLKKIDKMKMEFLSMMSHELRTPLSAIKAYSETLINSLDILDKDTLSEFLNTIFKESNHLDKLLNDLLDFSKLELKSLTLRRESFEFTELINEVISSLEEFSKTNDVKIILKSNENIILNLDRTRIKQILVNLIQNAIKYSDSKKEDKYVQINYEQNEENIIIYIEDNGIGIKEEYQEKIFEKFFRADSSLNYEIQGTGIGLSIVKELVELHNGKILLESEFEKGSKFIITLPKGVI
ncbi:MAG: two-component system, OmpR family, sensor kinase [Oceanotoga sp.]|nr:two-component system, OmpR family, sensor kinase [Oceanotoga sp.]